MYFWGTYYLNKFTYSVETFLLEILLGKIGSMKCVNTEFLNTDFVSSCPHFTVQNYQIMFLFPLPDAN